MHRCIPLPNRGRRRITSALMAAALTSPGAAAAKGADTPETAFERYREKINLHDFSRLEEDVIAPEARFVFGTEVHRGIAEARAAFNRTWSTIPDEVYTMEGAEWLAKDRRTALVSFRYRYRGTMRDGRVIEGGGLGANLFRRTPKGWRLVYEHLSPELPKKKGG